MIDVLIIVLYAFSIGSLIFVPMFLLMLLQDYVEEKKEQRNKRK